MVVAIQIHIDVHVLIFVSGNMCIEYTFNKHYILTLNVKIYERQMNYIKNTGINSIFSWLQLLNCLHWQLLFLAVSIHELHLRKPFKSSTQHDQQVVSRSTIPRCILKAYSHCDPTPALTKLNPYRYYMQNTFSC